MSSAALKHIRWPISLLILFWNLGCGRVVTECGGTPLNINRLSQIERSAFSSNSKAFLITPNPVDATGNISVQSLDSSLGNILDVFSLSSLISSNRLENDFLKVRIRSISDDLSILASPNSSGEFRFAVNDIHYGETMGYHSLSSIQAYVEALGFTTNKSRPLYVMPLASDSTNPRDVNAFYDHHRFEPSYPRELKLFGNTTRAPFQDQDIYWHEFGHYFVESLTADRGVDNAGDLGATFTEGAAIHECLADYGAESLSNRGYLGRWISQNFSGFAPGAPLRSAEDLNDEFSNFKNVTQFDSSGKNLDRYRLAEWCSRVLWDIRTQITTENPDEGRYYADRMIFSAVSMLKQDSAISDLKTALMNADQELTCGIHERSITQAFQSRGFDSEPSTFSQPLILRASLVWLQGSRSQFSFNFQIFNPNAQSARNVRLALVPRDSRISAVTYLQGYGDLGAGQTITVGSNAALPLDFSVQGSVDSTMTAGAKYELRVIIENGPQTVVQGAL